MYTNKSVLDDALHSMQRKIVQSIVGCSVVIIVSGALLLAPGLLSEDAVDTAVAKLSHPVQTFERAFASTRHPAEIEVLRPARWADDDRPAARSQSRTPEPVVGMTKSGEVGVDAFASAAPSPTIQKSGMPFSSAPMVSQVEPAIAVHPDPAEQPRAAAIVLASVDPAMVAVTPEEPTVNTRLLVSAEEIPTAFYEGPDALKIVPTPMPSPRPADLLARVKPRHQSPAEVLGLTGQTRARAERCLTQAVYFEARSEPYRGQVAVAQVVMNRVFSPYYPGDVCGVVFQNAHRYLSCQFTFACEGRALRVTEHGAWQRARRIAQQTLDGKIWRPEVAKATHYHADYVSPRWISEMRPLAKHGRHIFYRPHRWGDGRSELGWVMVHETPMPRPRPAAIVAAKPITLAVVQDVDGRSDTASGGTASR